MKNKYIRETYRYLRNLFIYRYSLLYSKEIKEYDNIIIISPHPDDEALGCGGIISHQISRERKLHIIVLTKGERVHGDNQIDKEDIKRQRQRLTFEANSCVGIQRENIHFLDYPDGTIDISNIQETQKLYELINKIKPDAIFIPHENEGWNDHVKTNKIIRKYPLDHKSIDIYSYCVWVWYAMPLRKTLSLDIKNCFYTKMKSNDMINKRKMLGIYFSPNWGIKYSGVLPPSLMRSCQYKKRDLFQDGLELFGNFSYLGVKCCKYREFYEFYTRLL